MDTKYGCAPCKNEERKLIREAKAKLKAEAKEKAAKAEDGSKK
jgi:hypothetical protein